MPNEFVARNGIIALNNSIITGSLNVTQGVTASLFGTASWAINTATASFIQNALSASFAGTASNVLGGAANYIPLFNTATTLSSSVMYQTGGNVGIGTTSPTANLQIGSATTSGTRTVLIQDSGYGIRLSGGTNSTNNYIQSIGTTIPLYFLAGNSNDANYIFSSTGNTGIGATSPSQKLEVQGQIQAGNDNVNNAGIIIARRGSSHQARSHYYLSAPESPTYQWIEGGIFTGEMSGTSVANNSGKPYYEQYVPAAFYKSFGFINQTTSGSAFTSGLATASITLYQGGDIAFAPILGNTAIGKTSANAKLDVNGSAIVSGSLTVTQGITGSLFGTSSWATNALTSSFVQNAVSASFATTASSADNFTVRGTLTAQTIIVQTITSSTNFITGSTRFGTLLTNTHQFTGSVSMTGSLNVVGAGITGSLFGTASWASNAISSSYALSASQAQNAVSASFASTASYILNAVSASFATTASLALNASVFPFTGSALITGSLGVRGNTTITGSLTVSSSAVATSLIGSGSAIFSVDGTLGRMFQIDDTLSGSLFSVNTAGGVPLIEAFSDNTVRIGQFGQRVLYVSQSRVGIGKETALNGILDVSGSTTMTGSLSVTQGITGSLFGTASFATTASFALNAGGGGGSAFPFAGNAVITGSLILTTGSLGNNAPVQYTQGYTASLSGSLSVISSVATSSYRSAFYNYVATQGVNARAGTVAAVWYLTTCSFAEYITTDIGTTANLDVTARISGGNVQLVAVGSGSWLINTLVNLI